MVFTKSNKLAAWLVVKWIIQVEVILLIYHRLIGFLAGANAEIGTVIPVDFGFMFAGKLRILPGLLWDFNLLSVGILGVLLVNIHQYVLLLPELVTPLSFNEEKRLLEMLVRFTVALQFPAPT